jgi:hypothetical protein
MQSKSLVMLLTATIALAISCVLVLEIITIEAPGVLRPILIYAAIVAPLVCQIFPTTVARIAWVPTLGFFTIALLGGIERHDLTLDVWLHATLLALLLTAYATLVHRAASWEQDLARALTFVSRSDLAVADAVERERLKRCEGIVVLCHRLNQPLSVLHLNWIRQECGEGESQHWSFASQFERLSMRESVLQQVGATIRESDIVLSDGTQNGLFVICPATYERGADLLAGRLESMLQREFAARVKRSMVTSDNHGFVLADLMIAARDSSTPARSVEYGAVVSLRSEAP